MQLIAPSVQHQTDAAGRWELSEGASLLSGGMAAQNLTSNFHFFSLKPWREEPRCSQLQQPAKGMRLQEVQSDTCKLLKQ